MWQLPGDDRLISLRATPFKDGACWSAIDDFGIRYDLHRGWTPWPVADRDVIAFLHGARSETLPYQLRAVRLLREMARRRGLDREKGATPSSSERSTARDASAVIDELFATFWDGERAATESSDVAAEEVLP
ncbi:MAG: hypothetical protein IPP07_29465 [Holophagales bacterium]|nr:hypothetical protein [Holophagales bacterium]